ncbi:MAG: helix-turn-helix domain-containing protein [Caldilinea sp.]|jgi:transcriptional regulator with XRE-family HTH domain
MAIKTHSFQPHSAGEADAVQTFGNRIRARRHELGISLGVLAERTGLTASFLSLVERDLSKPSLNSLRSIAEALAVPTFYFSQESSVGRAAAQNPVVRASQRVQITYPPGDVTSELLVPNLRNKLQVIVSQIQPSAGNIARPPQIETEECLLVLAGTLRVVLGDQEYELAAGDSIYIQGQELREIRALGQQEAVFLSAVTPPAF